MLIIGSTALAHWTSTRKPKDLDLIIREDEVEAYTSTLSLRKQRVDRWSQTLHTHDGQMIELFIARAGESLWHYLEHEDALHALKVAGPATLLSIKLGHIHFAKKVERYIKHANDISALWKLNGETDHISELTRLHYQATQERLGSLKTPSLMKSAAKFFGQSSDYVESHFVHDHIHWVMAHYEVPLYEKMKPDPTSVMCSREMWETFSEDDKCLTVLEEGYVIALERHLIPHLFNGQSYKDASWALQWALMRIGTTLCSGWFRKFAVTHYARIWELHNPEYVTRFLHAYDNGAIKLRGQELDLTGKMI